MTGSWTSAGNGCVEWNHSAKVWKNRHRGSVAPLRDKPPRSLVKAECHHHQPTPPNGHYSAGRPHFGSFDLRWATPLPSTRNLAKTVLCASRRCSMVRERGQITVVRHGIASLQPVCGQVTGRVPHGQGVRAGFPRQSCSPQAPVGCGCAATCLCGLPPSSVQSVRSTLPFVSPSPCPLWVPTGLVGACCFVSFTSGRFFHHGSFRVFLRFAGLFGRLSLSAGSGFCWFSLGGFWSGGGCCLGFAGGSASWLG